MLCKCFVFTGYVRLCYLLSVTLDDAGGPTPTELVRLLDQCDLSNSRNTTPNVSPSPSSLLTAGCSTFVPAIPQVTPPTSSAAAALDCTLQPPDNCDNLRDEPKATKF